jgi:hypothetical protein
VTPAALEMLSAMCWICSSTMPDGIAFFFFFFLQAVWLQHAEELAWQAQLYQLRTSQTVLETTVTKLEEQIHGSVTSSLKGLPTPPQ